jgi:hypothetical protein
VLAHRVDFVNGRAAGEQLPGQRLLANKRERRCGRGQHGRGSARDERDQKIAGARRARDFENAARALRAALIGDGVAARVQLNPVQTRDASLGNVHEATGDAAAQQLLNGSRHSRAGLTRADHLNAVEGRQAVACAPEPKDAAVEFHMIEHRAVRVRGKKPGAENLESVMSRSGHDSS